MKRCVAIDISDEGAVQIAAVDLAAGEEAKRRIEALTSEVEVGRVYEGTVAKIADFGAFVTIMLEKMDWFIFLKLPLNVLIMFLIT